MNDPNEEVPRYEEPGGQAGGGKEQPRGREVVIPPTVMSGVSSAIAKAELDQSITTARAYPRSIAGFLKGCRALATHSQAIAEQCTYKLPPRKNRDGKKEKQIEGPSVRMGEIVAATYGNCRAAARVLDIGPSFIVAQGVFHDLESNSQVSTEVRRSIVGKYGRYSEDMISVTANAACAIAKRNAVFQGIPRALWDEIHEDAKKVALGTTATMTQRRERAMQQVTELGVDALRVYAVLEVGGLADIDLQKMAELKSYLQAIADGEMTAEEVFPPITKPKTAAAGAAATEKGTDGLAARLGGAGAAAAETKVAEPEQKAAEEPKGKPKIVAETLEDVARDCAKVASKLGWDAETIKRTLAENGVKDFTKWSDLSLETLNKLRTMLNRVLAGA